MGKNMTKPPEYHCITLQLRKFKAQITLRQCLHRAFSSSLTSRGNSISYQPEITNIFVVSCLIFFPFFFFWLYIFAALCSVVHVKTK